MKICLITSMYPTPSAPHAGVFITRRIEALQELGASVDAYAIIREESWLVSLFRRLVGKKTKEKFGSIIKSDNVNVNYQVIKVHLNLFEFIWNFFTHEKYYVKKEARKLNIISGDYDVVHAHWLYPNGAAVVIFAHKRRLPVMITCHGSDINRELRNPKNRAAALTALESADSVEFVSHRLYNTSMQLGFSGQHSHILPNGIKCIPILAEKQPTIVKRVGFVGNLIPVKRVDSFPAIFSKIIAKYKNVEFFIIGDGYMRSDLEKLLKDYPVTFTGRIPQEDVLKEMSMMDVMILPSRNEGWPCVVLEAQSCGIQVVGSDNGGIAESIGDERYVVPEGENFESRFADKVIDVLSGQLSVEPQTLIERSRDFLWINLQRSELEQYSRLR